MSFPFRFIFVFFFVLLLRPLHVYAYLDEILTSADDVWAAAKTVMEPQGIRSENKAAYTLKSKWIEDSVRKEKRLFPSAVGIDTTIPRTLKRRYRMTLQLTETATGTQIQVQGKFQERPFGAPEHQARWKNVKPGTEDYEVERSLFFKILMELARMRSSQNQP